MTAILKIHENRDSFKSPEYLLLRIKSILVNRTKITTELKRSIIEDVKNSELDCFKKKYILNQMKRLSAQR